MILNEVDDKSILHSRQVCKLWYSRLNNRWQNRKPQYKTSFTVILGKKGKGDGQFNYPSGVTLDSKGNIIVADTNNHRIQIFNAQGQFLRKWGK